MDAHVDIANANTLSLYSELATAGNAVVDGTRLEERFVAGTISNLAIRLSVLISISDYQF